MKKTLRLLLMSMFVLCAGQVMAEEVVFDFNNDYATLFPSITGTSSNDSHDGDITETTTSIAVNGVTVTVSPADEGVSNANRIWSSNPRLRMYSGTITFASAGDNITKMVLTRSTNGSKVANNNTADSGTLTTTDQQSNGEVTWTGDAQSVTINIAGNSQFSKVIITLGEGGGDTPVDPQPGEVKSVSVAEALAVIDALEDGAKTTEEYKVKGFVVTVTEISTQFGNATFTIADAKGGSPVLTFYRGYGLNGATITDENLVKVDDEVEVQGLLQKYVKNDVVTPEVAQGGKIISINGGGEIVSDPATPVASIAALLEMENTNNVELTLTDAKVLFNDGNYIYVRENGKALCFYQINGLKDAVKNNSVINGKLIGDYEVYRLMPELKSNKDTNIDGLTIEDSEEAAEPVQTTLAAVAQGVNVCDLVTLSATLVREVTYKDDGVTVSSTKYYLEDGAVKLVVVNNSKNLKALADEADETGQAKVITVVGVVNTASDAYQVKLTQDAVDAQAGKKGDVNGDGTVDVADISAIISYMAGTASYEGADVNGDQTVDVADISSVISIMASGE